MKTISRTTVWALLLSVLAGSVAVVEAGTGRRKGTSGAQELLIPLGARGIGLSGSYTSGIQGVEAMYWNPAGVAILPGSAEAMFTHMNYMADVSVEYAAVAARLGEFGTLGFSIQTLNFGDIPITTTAYPDGTGETYSPNYITLALNFSKMMTDRIAFGLNLKVVSETIMRESATGIAFDFGLQYQTGLRGFKFGVAMKNLGPNMRFDGPDLEQTVQIPGTEPGSQPRPLRITAQEFDLPSTLEFGTSYEISLMAQSSLVLTGTFVHNNFSYDDFRIGGEWSYDNTLFVRGGYSLSPDLPTEEAMYTFTVGAGVKFNLSPTMNIAVDYGYQATEFFDDNHVFGIKLGL
ncbi:MAG: hypothetical protein HBSIN02_19710 [Bacteroidia bacterium]|nr:MAG: hypothetical protein HBSIN02_19710 [Bacteroidia bacterium]